MPSSLGPEYFSSRDFESLTSTASLLVFDFEASLRERQAALFF